MTHTHYTHLGELDLHEKGMLAPAAPRPAPGVLRSGGPCRAGRGTAHAQRRGATPGWRQEGGGRGVEAGGEREGRRGKNDQHWFIANSEYECVNWKVGKIGKFLCIYKPPLASQVVTINTYVAIW